MKRGLNSWRSLSRIALPNLDLDYLCDDANRDVIAENIRQRKTVGNIDRVRELHSKWLKEACESSKAGIYKQLIREASEIPNFSHPNSPIGEEDKAVTLETVGKHRDFTFRPRGVVDIGEWLGHLRCYNTTLTTGPRTFYFADAFARLEHALVRYTLTKALEKGFILMSVPDIVESSAIECAGFKTTGERTQVYSLDTKPERDGLSLSGTGEMAFVGYLTNQILDYKQLPLKFVTVSRCYRAEASNVREEAGIYRVHQFTKVELFGVTANETGKESEELFTEIVDLQKDLFRDIDIPFRILNMPTAELGAPAYCKYDFESWMPEKRFWGEITSTSNCTDFQCRRMHLTYRRPDSVEMRHCHTVNGTGCAVPRMVMAIVENYQNQDRTVSIPVVLQSLMGGDKLITNSPSTPTPRWIRSKKH